MNFLKKSKQIEKTSGLDFSQFTQKLNKKLEISKSERYFDPKRFEFIEKN